MKTFEINSLPLNEVLQDLAACFGTRCVRNCDEYFVKIPATWGSGYIKGISFGSGVGLIQYVCKFHTDLELIFSVNKIHPVKFLYCLAGAVEHRFQNNPHSNILNKYQNAIVASQGNNGHILRFAAQTQTRLCSLEINRKEFKSHFSCYLQKTTLGLQELFNDETAKRSFYHEGLYSLQIAHYMEEIDVFSHKNLIKRIFMEGKAWQIFSSQLMQYEDALYLVDDRKVLRKSELQSIKHAVKIIEMELENLESVQSLANRVGLNQNKLQDGFHNVYALSVKGYIQKERLKLAVSLLKNTNISMAEIMERVGLTSQSYFSKIFRDRYDLTPSRYRKLCNV